tara:strand:- start:1497 stop:1682 length:186 start_codon:yes stop_codon:yes gene_type:complete
MSDKLKFNFDKFVNDLDKRTSESAAQREEFFEGQEELPQRRYNNLYREKWQNRIKFLRRKK